MFRSPISMYLYMYCVIRALRGLALSLVETFAFSWGIWGLRVRIGLGSNTAMSSQSLIRFIYVSAVPPPPVSFA